MLAVVPLLEARGPETHTTNVTVVDADGNACVFTTSLGLGSGTSLPGLDLHLNSMLGEVDLLVGNVRPRRADGVDDGADTGARRRRLELAISAPPAGRGCGPRSRCRSRGCSTRGSTRSRRRPAAVPIPWTAWSTPSRASTWTRSRSSQRRDAPCGAGRCAPLFGGVSAVGHAGAAAGPEAERRSASPPLTGTLAESQPTVPAVRAARVLLHRAATGRLGVDPPALQAADAGQKGQGRLVVSPDAHMD